MLRTIFSDKPYGHSPMVQWLFQYLEYSKWWYQMIQAYIPQSWEINIYILDGISYASLCIYKNLCIYMEIIICNMDVIIENWNRQKPHILETWGSHDENSSHCSHIPVISYMIFHAYSMIPPDTTIWTTICRWISHENLLNSHQSFPLKRKAPPALWCGCSFPWSSRAASPKRAMTWTRDGVFYSFLNLIVVSFLKWAWKREKA